MHWQPQGIVEQAHAEVLIEILLQQARRYGAVWMLADGRQLIRASAEARSLYARRLKEHRPTMCVAFYCAGLMARTAITMVMRGAMLLSGLSVDLHFAETEQEARKYLSARSRSGSN